MLGKVVEVSVERGNKVFKSYIFLMHTEHKRSNESEQFVNFTQRQTDLKVKKKAVTKSTNTYNRILAIMKFLGPITLIVLIDFCPV